MVRVAVSEKRNRGTGARSSQRVERRPGEEMVDCCRREKNNKVRDGVG